VLTTRPRRGAGVFKRQLGGGEMNTGVDERMSLSDRVWDQLGEAGIVLLVLSMVFIAVMVMLEPM
jgi:hypothetical protein